MKTILGKIFRIIWKTCLLFVILSITSVVVYKWVLVPITPLMVIRCIEQKSEGKEIIMKHDWVSLQKISPQLQLAVVCSEDQNYLKHRGFDFGAIQKAFKENERGKRVRGGSTITQQTAKNVFLWQGRSYLRKGLEAWFTLLIEFFWNKERIMEVYLNSIEMGNGIYGAEAAANFYWKTSAQNLSRTQAAAIAAVLPNPRKYSANPPGPYVQARIGWIVGQMAQWGTLRFE